MTDPEVPSTKEVLLDHLYAIVGEFDSENASKITGMFSELPNTHLMLLLGNRELLRKKATEAGQIIHRGCPELSRNGIEMDNTEQATHLHSNTSRQKTDTLTESGSSDIGTPLDDHELFTFRSDSHESKTCRNVTQTSENLADQLYAAVSQIHPENAPKITGMLMEMEPAKIKELLQNSDDLVSAIDACKQALVETNQWIL